MNELGIVLFVIFAAGVVLLIGRVVARTRPIEIGRRFPPISDEEFVALCTPGTSPDVALRVRRIIAKHLAVDYDQVHPSMNFVEDLGAD